MPLFDYSGQLASGALIEGTIESNDHAQAGVTLQGMGVRTASVRAAKCAAFVAPLSLADLTFFNEQLASLTRAGLPLEPGLRQLASDVGSRKLKRLLLDLADDLRNGVELSQALERQQRRFPPQYASVVRAGLATGDLSGTLYGLTTHVRLKSVARRALLEIIAYPLVVLFLTFLVTSFLMRAVVPQLQALCEELMREPRMFGLSAPIRDQFIFVLGRAWPAIELVLAALLGAAFVSVLVLSLPGMRAVRERVLRATPGLAPVYWSSALARFVHTTALGAYSGTPLPEMVAAGGAASGSPALAGSARRVAEKLAQGASLEQAAAGERDIPALWTCAVLAAAPRGDLPGTLAELARTFESRAERCVDALRVVLGPLLFLVMAGSVGSLIVSLMTFVSTYLRALITGLSR
ncbi:MAG: Type II secretion system protein F [Phycisphaerae bacterium]|nr:Type II secretion system protein F [Phycisphaerae bacterium]